MSLAGTNNPSVPQLADLGRRLIAATLPHLRRGDERAIVEELRARWPLRRLVDLLDCPDDDANCRAARNAAVRAADLARAN